MSERYDRKRCRICGKECYVRLSDGKVVESELCEHIMIHLWKDSSNIPFMAVLGYKKKYRKRNKKLGHLNTDDKDPLRWY